MHPGHLHDATSPVKFASGSVAQWKPSNPNTNESVRISEVTVHARSVLSESRGCASLLERFMEGVGVLIERFHSEEVRHDHVMIVCGPCNVSQHEIGFGEQSKPLASCSDPELSRGLRAQTIH